MTTTQLRNSRRRKRQPADRAYAVRRRRVSAVFGKKFDKKRSVFVLHTLIGRATTRVFQLKINDRERVPM